MDKFQFITSALPYANGPLHLGHMVEYIQSDIYVRYLRQIGKKVAFICADDAHGTPIELNARKKGILPSELVSQIYIEHKKDFADFLISFDNFYTTNSPENKELSIWIFTTLKTKGFIYEKEIELTYCENDKRFLPDRYVRGICPNCKSADQYGDVCEKCNSTYSPIDLIEPKCALCQNPAIRKNSNHFFFALSKFTDKLRNWLNSANIQPEVRNSVMNWVENGLEDWCISRDGPYFGFEIPNTKDKYFYVWLDAPIGYFASLKNYSEKNSLDFDSILKSNSMTHFIGKDIVYFHLLFWPAMLMACDLELPKRIQVHGFLTVAKEKMSKSRGTFITARHYLDNLSPELLRYYFASNQTSTLNDMDFDFLDFTSKINNELVSNIANFTYRTLSFCKDKFDSNVTVSELDLGLQEKRLETLRKIDNAYLDLSYREAIREILHLSDLGNKYFQLKEPWKLYKEDKEECHKVISNAIMLVADLSFVLAPILPKFCEDLRRQLNILEISKPGGSQIVSKISNPKILLTKIEEKNVLALKTSNPLSSLNLKVAKIIEIIDHPNADKLYVLKLDLGETQRQLVAGLKAYLTPEQLLGKHVVIVANLKPAKLRGVESQGMLLAADDGINVTPLDAKNSKLGSNLSAGTIELNSHSEITYEEFAKIKLHSENNKAYAEGEVLRSSTDDIFVALKDKAKIR